MAIKVLVVDDYKEHVDTLVNTLNMYGCEARGVEDFSSGLLAVEEFKPDLLIVDGLLEGMRAWQFAFKILQEYYKDHGLNTERANKPYMVALTGFASTLQRRLCEECGYDEYVSKPIELATLLSWVQKARQRANV